MAIDKPRTIDAALLAGRSTAEDAGGETFLSREEWASAQGKKVSPTALRSRRSRRSRSSARSRHQRGRVFRGRDKGNEEKWQAIGVTRRCRAAPGEKQATPLKGRDRMTKQSPTCSRPTMIGRCNLRAHVVEVESRPSANGRSTSVQRSEADLDEDSGERRTLSVASRKTVQSSICADRFVDRRQFLEEDFFVACLLDPSADRAEIVAFGVLVTRLKSADAARAD